MAPKTDQSGKIIPRNEPKRDLPALLRDMGPEIARALPKHISPDRMVRIAMTALRTNSALGRCTPGSFLGAVLSAAQLGLEPNTPLGQCYLIPYKDECTLQIGYQGMLELARRSGLVRAIYAYVVRAGDEFAYSLGLDPDLRHIPSEDEGRENKPITHAYAVAKLADGERVFIVLTRAQIEARRKRSRASNSGPWVTDYEAMCLKTAVRALFRWVPKSPEMALAAALDEAPEIGTQQSAALSPEVSRLLESQGLQVDAEGEVQTAESVDPETGEVTEGPRQREPGED